MSCPDLIGGSLEPCGLLLPDSIVVHPLGLVCLVRTQLFGSKKGGGGGVIRSSKRQDGHEHTKRLWNASCLGSPKQSVARHSVELGVPKTAIQNVVHKSPNITHPGLQ
jgi:hypothetical protein